MALSNIIVDVNQAKELINQGKLLVIAGDHQLLKNLPKGNWIGGSIPYFMTPEGGRHINDKLLITDFSDYVKKFTIKEYKENQISEIPDNYPEHGFNYILIPGMSDTLKTFAYKTESEFKFFYSPLTGWVTGTSLDKINDKFPIIVNGQTLETSDDAAIVIHAELPEYLEAKIDIVNIFEQGDGDLIFFDNDRFEIYECYINGERRIFADYLRENNIDFSHPLVANYNGIPINVSIKSSTDIFVETFAPVRRGVKYKFAKRLENYEHEFSLKIPEYQQDVVSTCNCIYNYIFGKLENKKLPYTGPFTFGEIAYILLNQTMVTLKITEKNK